MLATFANSDAHYAIKFPSDFINVEQSVNIGLLMILQSFQRRCQMDANKITLLRPLKYPVIALFNQ